MVMSMKHAILGLLDLAPMSGYDIKKSFDASIAHFWAGDQSQIYRTLASLVDEGLATVSVEEQDTRPNRNVHTITEAGRDQLDHWLRSPLDREVSREPFLARLFFAGRAGSAAVMAMLRERRAVAVAQLAVLEEIRAAEGVASGLSARLRLATLDNGIAHTRTELEWLDELEKAL
jgi:DNA-binding PadR family transcriptional regulator